MFPPSSIGGQSGDHGAELWPKIILGVFVISVYGASYTPVKGLIGNGKSASYLF